MDIEVAHDVSITELTEAISARFLIQCRAAYFN
jgi:hypothetical protein